MGGIAVSATGTSANAGAGITSTITSIGLSPGNIHAIIALILILAYLSITKADDRGYSDLSDGLTAMAIPLLVVFAGIVFWNSLLVIQGP